MPNPGDDARRKLLLRERQQQLRVIIEFKKIEKRLQVELYDVLFRIDHARRTEGNARPGDLIEQARIRNLLDQVSDEIFRSSQRLGLDTARLQTAAVNIAKDEAGQYAALRTDLSFFDDVATRELIGSAGDGKPLGVYFSKLSKPVRQQMFDALFYGIAAGKSNQQIAREVNQAVGNGAAAAMTIVRTETNRTYREASRKFYQESDLVRGWRWVAALDLTTCPICWSQHGRVFATRVKMATHPNCRCTIVPVFADDPKSETGPERFAKLTLEQQRAILGPRRLALYNQGANLSDFVETVPTPFGPGRRIRPLDLTTFTPNPRTPAGSASGPPKILTPDPALTDRLTPKSTLTAAIKPGDPVPRFATTPALEEYLERRFPGTKFDLAGISRDADLLQIQADEITRLMDRYPEVASRLQYFGTYSDPAKFRPAGSGGRVQRNAYAHASIHDGKYIGLSRAWYGDAKRYIDSKKRSGAINWTVSDNPRATTTHEFGHLVDSWLITPGRRNGGIGQDALTRVLDPAAPTTFEDLRNKIIRKFKPKPREISDYARTNRVEQFAEGFSQFWNRPASEHSAFTKAQAKLIEMAQTRTRYPAGLQRSIGNLSDADARTMRREINEIYLELGLKSPYRKNEL